jgi:DNA-binding beta-propeller fold protein YncE
VAQDGQNTCVFVGNGYSSTISAMKMTDANPYLQVVDTYSSPDGGSGLYFGIGITVANGYLYANNTGNGSTIPPNIDVWQITAGCTLTFSTSYPDTYGLGDGIIDGMAVTPNGKYLVVAYGDGSVGSYAIGGGSISLVSQELIVGRSVGQGAYAGSVAISANGQWAIFGDFSPFNTTQFDVASIGSTGVLAPTTTYGGTGSLGPGLQTNGISLSPNNQFIYSVDTGSGQETTVSFDSTTGVISYPNNCITNLKGYNSEWSYASQSAVVTSTASGGGIYISEGFLPNSQDSYIALLSVNSKTGCATEVTNSPFADPNGNALQSITSYRR